MISRRGFWFLRPRERLRAGSVCASPMLRRRCADPGLSGLQVAARPYAQSHMQKRCIVTVKATARLAIFWKLRFCQCLATWKTSAYLYYTGDSRRLARLWMLERHL